MKRIVSLWFPKLSADRLARTSKKEWSARAAATVLWREGCPRLAALNVHARAAGLRPHMRLADARGQIAAGQAGLILYDISTGVPFRQSLAGLIGALAARGVRKSSGPSQRVLPGAMPPSSAAPD